MAAILVLLSFALQSVVLAQTDEEDAALGTHLNRTIVFEGQEFNVEVVLTAPVENLYGLQFDLIFDRDHIRVIDGNGEAEGSIQAGGLIAADVVDTPGPDYVIAVNEADNLTGRATFAASLLSPAPPASGIGTLARIRFAAIALGNTSLLFENVVLSDNQGREIPAEFAGGSVDVVPQGTCGDQNDDDDVTVADAIIQLQIEARYIIPTPSQLKLGDLDGDGLVDEDDAEDVLERAADTTPPFAQCGEIGP